MEDFNPNRYAVIHEKNPREIVMLRGFGCSWRRCRFCDYHLDFSPDSSANFALNREQLEKVTGIHQKLEVINSGSFVDLDEETLALIEKVCKDCHITQVHFECHWRHWRNILTKSAFCKASPARLRKAWTGTSKLALPTLSGSASTLCRKTKSPSSQIPVSLKYSPGNFTQNT